MEQRLPDGTLADWERRAQLLLAELCGSEQQIFVHPGPMLVKTLEQFDGVHGHPSRSGAVKPNSITWSRSSLCRVRLRMPLSGGWTSFARSLKCVYGKVIRAAPSSGASAVMLRIVLLRTHDAGARSSRPGAWAMNETTTADRCRGVLLGLAAGDRNGGPICMAVRLAESLLEL